MTATLSRILEETRQRLAPLRKRQRVLEERAARAEAPPSWTDAFRTAEVSVVAEVKRRSPSVGDISPWLDPAAHACAYESGGAGAISVLTNGPYFGGTLADLETVRRSVRLPVLRKDFILDPVQLYESRAAGASAVLLIVRALEGAQLADLSALAAELGLGTLVEIHDASELETALGIGPPVLGVNSRDLDTFTVDLTRTAELLRLVPPHVVVVAESGILGRADVEQVAQWGADAVLVGSQVAKAVDPEGAVRELAGVRRHGRS